MMTGIDQIDTDVTRIIKSRLRAVGLTVTDVVVVGSGILAALSIRSSNDIDLLVSKDTFKRIVLTGAAVSSHTDGSSKIDIDDVEIMDDWFGETKDDIWSRATIIDDVPFLPLRDVRTYKEQMNREKDQRDIRLIDAYIDEHTPKT